MPDCGLPCEWLSMDAEEIVVMPGEDIETDRLFPKRVARNHRVRCPEHGIRIIQKIGSHISVTPRPKSGVERRRKNKNRL